MTRWALLLHTATKWLVQVNCNAERFNVGVIREPNPPESHISLTVQTRRDQSKAKQATQQPNEQYKIIIKFFSLSTTLFSPANSSIIYTEPFLFIQFLQLPLPLTAPPTPSASPSSHSTRFPFSYLCSLTHCGS